MHINAQRALTNDPWFVTGAALALLLAFLVMAGPWLAMYDPHDMSFRPLSPPSSEHWLGVDDGGGGIFSAIPHGGRNTPAFDPTTRMAAFVVGVSV